MSLMSDNGDIREDLRVPDNEVGKEIESKFEAGEEFMVSLVFSYNSYLSARPKVVAVTVVNLSKAQWCGLIPGL